MRLLFVRHSDAMVRFGTVCYQSLGIAGRPGSVYLCLGVVVYCSRGRMKDEEDEVLFWNETKAKLRVATETHLRLMIKHKPFRQHKSAIPGLHYQED